jgi:hypothetical protein
VLRKDEAYIDVYLFGYRLDDTSSGEILDLLLSGICPICGEIDDSLEIDDFGSVGDSFEWGCLHCNARVDVETTH